MVLRPGPGHVGAQVWTVLPLLQAPVYPSRGFSPCPSYPPTRPELGDHLPFEAASSYMLPPKATAQGTGAVRADLSPLECLVGPAGNSPASPQPSPDPCTHGCCVCVCVCVCVTLAPGVWGGAARPACPGGLSLPPHHPTPLLTWLSLPTHAREPGSSLCVQSPVLWDGWWVQLGPYPSPEDQLCQSPDPLTAGPAPSTGPSTHTGSAHSVLLKRKAIVSQACLRVCMHAYRGCVSV